MVSLVPSSNRYTIGDLIGKGNFGDVFRAHDPEEHGLVAIKWLTKRGIDEKHRRRAYTEIDILMDLDHPNIIGFLGGFNQKGHVWAMLEYCFNGDLYDHICATPNGLPEDEARRLFGQLMSAVGYLHSNGVAHLDIKPENILLDNQMSVKLTDFGAAISEATGYKVERFRGRGGTLKYMAPEVLLWAPTAECNASYSATLADLWSCGVTLFVMLSKRFPFHASNVPALRMEIILGNIQWPSQGISEEARDLISNMLEKIRENRFRIREILNSSWMRS